MIKTTVKKVVFNSFQKKLAIFIAIVVGLISLFVSYYFPAQFEDQQRNAVVDKVNSMLNIVSRFVHVEEAKTTYELVEKLVNPIILDENTEFLVIYNLNNDSLVYHFNIEKAKENNLDNNFGNKFSSIDPSIYISSAIIQDQSNSELIMHFGYSLKSINSEISDFQKNISLVSLLIFLVGLFAVYDISTLLTKPLKKLVETAERISSGDLDCRAVINSGDEVGHLAASFNKMVENLILANTKLKEQLNETQKEIVERKKIEKELRESQNKFKLIFNDSYDPIFVFEINDEVEAGKFIELNFIACKTLGYNKLELLSLTPYDILAVKDKMAIQNLIWNVIKSKNYQMETVFQNKAGDDIYVELSASLLHIEGKKRIMIIARDITDRKISEAALKASEEQFRVLFEKAPIGLILTNTNGQIQKVNQALCNILGYEEKELAEIQLTDISHSQDRELEEVELKKLMQENLERVVLEKRLFTKSGSIIDTIVNIVMLRDNESRPSQFLEQIVDITELKHYQKELLDAKEKAEESNKLKSAFLAQMSHEIRTPINTVLNFNSLIREEIGDDVSEDIKESFKVIDSGSKRLIRTIDSILNMSQFKAGSFDVTYEKVDLLEDILKDLCLEFKQNAEINRLKFKLEINTNNTIVWGDKYSLTQMIANLIDNAIKYTKKGSVLVRLKEMENSYLVLEVIDTGIGILEEYLAELFEPFSQEDIGYTRKFEGNGLGLALVKNYCDLNRTKISVKSKKGIGSKFVVTFKQIADKETPNLLST